MKKLILVTLVAAAAGSALAVDAGLKSDDQKVGYAIGTDIGKTFAEMNADGNNVNFDALLAGIHDAYEKKELKMSPEEMETAMRDFAQKRQAQLKAKAEKALADNKAASEKFLEENAKKDGVKTTASGLQYKIIKEGTGAAPKANDDVTVEYEGRLIDGKVFDSSKNSGKPVTFNVQEVIPGWVEGLQLMKEGSEYTFYIPAKLAYGDYGQPQAGIMPGSALVFDVKLVKVESKVADKAAAAAPAKENAEKAASAKPAEDSAKK